VRWNAHKSYLVELASAGVPVVPTTLVPHGAGEVSLIYFDGTLSHAVRKVPAAGDFRVQPQYGGRVLAHTAGPEDLATAQSVLAAVPGVPAYARIDLVRGRTAHF
jgi:hypothetical protein